MQYPNNDMDELFRKAAESYPLNTGSANWEAVQSALAGEEKRSQPQKGNLRWLLVLLPFLLLGLHLNKALVSSRSRTAAMERLPQSAALPAGKVNGGTAGSAPHPATGAASLAGPGLNRQPSRMATLRLPLFRLTTAQGYRHPATDDNAEHEETPVFTTPLAAAPATAESAGLAKLNANATIIPADTVAEATNILSGAVQTQLAEENRSHTEKKRSPKKRFYVGLIGGPDVSTVKFQQFSNTGFSAGILAGYALNDRLALEAGVLSSEKHYYSDGADYKADGYSPPSYAKLIAVDGGCRMVEIPVALRYTFSRQEKGAWFATAGVSSYLMQREDYSLDYLYPSSGNVATHKQSYTDKDQYWLATLQLSLGYSTKLSNLGNVRIEPYYALPLKGMGHGRLPVSSLGVRFGITVPQF